MKLIRLLFIIIPLSSLTVQAQEVFRIKGLCIGAPSAEDVDEFVSIIDSHLAGAGVNTLILRVDFGYRYQSHPELAGSNPLEKEDVKKLVNVCHKNGIRLIPQINLLGHQSWSTRPGKLLEIYPGFDETPGIQLPAEYKWPNPDGLYCKSYCPLHPDVHTIVFDLVDELTEVFEADAFHAGMDEVFYIGHTQCSRCNGLDPAGLFAGEVTRIHDHLVQRKKEMWIWGDRLIDGKTTGIGEWEASMNNTHRAIDMIPKDVVICDWHYEKAHPTPVLFAAKGFTVVACPWKNSEAATEQVAMLKGLMKNGSGAMKARYGGILHTYWSSAHQFMNAISARGDSLTDDPSVKCFLELTKVW